jgi:hypothetical protein
MEHSPEPQRTDRYRLSVVQRRVLTVGVLATVLAGCAADSSVDTTTSLTQPSEQTGVPSTTVSVDGSTEATDQDSTRTAPEAADIPPVLDWSAPLIGGGTIDMATLAGQQVLLWFWAPY